MQIISTPAKENFNIKFPPSRRKGLFQMNQVLTFDSISFVQVNFPFPLRLIWLYDDKKSPRDSTVELPFGTLIIQGRQSILVGTGTVNGTGN